MTEAKRRSTVFCDKGTASAQVGLDPSAMKRPPAAALSVLAVCSSSARFSPFLLGRQLDFLDQFAKPVHFTLLGDKVGDLVDRVRILLLSTHFEPPNQAALAATMAQKWGFIHVASLRATNGLNRPSGEGGFVMLFDGFNIFGVHIQYWMLLAVLIGVIAVLYINR
jgi:hypothetical protein